MATDGTPEPAAKRCGEAIARLRTARRWSRAHLIIRLYDELSPDDPSYDSISETWLARLENGRMVKVPRQTVEALCRALRCTPRERAHVLLHADRCALTDHESAPTAPAEVLAYVMDRLYSETHDLLTGLLGPRAPESVDEMELLEMASEALDTLIARRTRQVAQAAAANGHGHGCGHGHAPQRPPHLARDGRISLVPRLPAQSGAAR
jgi:transcriptional regulator with XRE-family HTH domain